MNTVLSVQKSLDIIDAVAAADSSAGIGTRELARRLGLSPTSVHNIAATLVQRGYLLQDETTRRYRVGLHLLAMVGGSGIGQAFAELARPTLQHLAGDLQESVMLAGFVNGRMMKLDYIASSHVLRVEEPDDIASYAHCMACGKILLAAMTDDELTRFLTAQPLKKFTAGTIVNKAQLAGELQRIQNDDHSEVVDELCEGISALAVGIRGSRDNIIAALGVSVPSVRFKLTWRAKTLKKLKAAAVEIEQLCSKV
ncbi:MAG: IclR family transcriptional regulator [Phycisphaerae bacterium]|nr:IclR family transcriptional regulator [Phycisphaerae bacterium]